MPVWPKTINHNDDWNDFIIKVNVAYVGETGEEFRVVDQLTNVRIKGEELRAVECRSYSPVVHDPLIQAFSPVCRVLYVQPFSMCDQTR